MNNKGLLASIAFLTCATVSSDVVATSIRKSFLAAVPLDRFSSFATLLVSLFDDFFLGASFLVSTVGAAAALMLDLFALTFCAISTHRGWNTSHTESFEPES